MVGFIDAHRDAHGVEPICKVLPIAPYTYYERLAKRADPARLSERARRDEALRPEILRVFEENWRVYGVRKIWRQRECPVFCVWLIGSMLPERSKDDDDFERSAGRVAEGLQAA